MSTKQITPIETIENTDRSDEVLENKDLKKKKDIIEDENEFYLNVLYQMCVPA